MSKTHWMDYQQLTFTRWANEHLADRGMKITDLKTDLCNGLALCNLVEILSNKSVGRYNRHPTINIQKLENLNMALAFLTANDIKLVNMSAEDIFGGNLNLILGLIWTIILRFEINKGDSDLLKWVQSKIPEYNITGFQKDWRDGRAICGLVNAIKPGAIPDHRSLDPANALANADRGITEGERSLGVEPLMMPDEMVSKKINKMACMTYIAQYRNLSERDFKNAHRCQAYGPGLVEAIANTEAPFTVETPADVNGKLAIKIEGAKGEVPCAMKAGAGGVYQCAYTPKHVGSLEITITLDGDAIPGSTFKVVVLERASLGGEGKIRVFFSSTSGTTKGRSDFFKLQNLFQAKKVHLMANFDPWVAVDLMSKEDRDAVFRVAGTRTLPIVMIDDQYRGDYDAMEKLNEVGKLDDLLNVEAQGALVSEAAHSARMKAATAGGVSSSSAEPDKDAAARAQAEEKAAAAKSEEAEKRNAANKAKWAANKAKKDAEEQAKKDLAKNQAILCTKCGKDTKGKKFCFECGARAPTA